MIELIQFPWSPYCLVQKRILEAVGNPFKVTDIPPGDRNLVWRLSKERYYQVPVLRDGRTVIFETGQNSQVIAKYLDQKYQLGLFPTTWDGVQKILWKNIENEVEEMTFKLNDIHFREFVPKTGHCGYIRHKERKFGPGCVEEWAGRRKELVAELARRLLPYDQMVCDKPYLLGERPLFVDFDLWGMLANFLYSGHYRFPAVHPRLRRWYGRMSEVSFVAS